MLCWKTKSPCVAEQRWGLNFSTWKEDASVHAKQQINPAHRGRCVCIFNCFHLEEIYKSTMHLFETRSIKFIS